MITSVDCFYLPSFSSGDNAPQATGKSVSPEVINNSNVNPEQINNLLVGLLSLLERPYIESTFSEVVRFLSREDIKKSIIECLKECMEKKDAPLFESFHEMICNLEDNCSNLVLQDEGATEQLKRKKRLDKNDIDVNKVNDLLRSRSAQAASSSQALLSEIAVTNKKRDDIYDEEWTKDGITTGTSYATLWASIAKAISKIKLEYVDFYATLMKKYTDMYQSYNINVQSASAAAVSSGNDGNNVSFNEKIMKQGYAKFRYYLNGVAPGVVKNWDKMSEDDKRSMKITLEPAFGVSDNGKISFNLKEFTEIENKMPNREGNQVPTTSYHTWLTSFNAVGSALQSNMQAFAQRYSQANSTFDNLNKVLSGVIIALGDIAKDLLKSIG